MVTVHYFYDPMCGWCYGATPITEILHTAPNIKLVLHAGGMIRRREMDNGFRAMAQNFDKKISSQTGKLFSKAYHNRLASNNVIVLDSYITAKAVSVMEQLYDKGFAMLQAIQQAHYQFAQDVSDYSVLSTIATQLGVEESEWLTLMKLKAQQINDSIEQSRQLMRQWDVSGFPTYIMEKEGELTTLPHKDYYQSIEKWKALIKQL